MSEVNYLALLAAAVAAFVVSTVWYALLGGQLAAAGPADGPAAGGAPARPPAWKLLVELSRSLVVAAVLAGLVIEVGIAGLAGAVLLGLVVWLGFPVVLLLGSIIWEDVPWRQAAIHAGDWLVKLVVVAVIVAAWQ